MVNSTELRIRLFDSVRPALINQAVVLEF